MLEVIEREPASTNNSTVLDVGCVWSLYQYALDKVHKLDYTGIDVCKNMILYVKNLSQCYIYLRRYISIQY